MSIKFPLVSIIIPSYNHEKYIIGCITSVFNQTYKNIELIVIDDGSSDSSPHLIRKLKESHDFYFEIQDNMGLSNTLNKGIALAKGKYICTVGSDDILMLDKTEKQITFMEEHEDIAVCGGNAIVIDDRGKIVNKRQEFPNDREITFRFLFRHCGPGLYASSAMIRKSVLDVEGGYDPEIPLEDMYMWLKLTNRGYQIYGLNDILIYYRKHPSNSYKDVSYMYSSIMKTYYPYRFEPGYNEVTAKLSRSYFLKASKVDNRLALAILKDLPISRYNLKVLRGLTYLLRPKKKLIRVHG